MGYENGGEVPLLLYCRTFHPVDYHWCKLHLLTG